MTDVAQFTQTQIDIIRREIVSGRYSDSEIIEHVLARFNRIEMVIDAERQLSEE